MDLKQIELREKQLLKSFLDVFLLVRKIIKGLQSEDIKMTAQLLKEISSFLREARTVLQEAKGVAEIAAALDEEKADLQSVYDDIPDFDDTGMEPLQ